MSNEVYPADPAELIPRISAGFHAPSIRTVDGYVNNVTIIGEELVVKIPQDASPMRLQLLRHEQQALDYMQCVDVSPFAVPKLVEYSENPAYLIATYVPGDTYSPDEIRALPKSAYEQLGRDLGGFMVRLAMSAENYDGGKGAPSVARGWPDIFKEYIDDFSDPRYPVLSSLARRLYARWANLRADFGSQALKVIHGDITSGNITLTNGKLNGIIDFGRLSCGEVADDLSCLADIDPSLLAICALELQSNNIDINTEYAMLWRELKDLHVLPYWIKTGNTKHANFVAIRELVARRYAELHWAELFSVGLVPSVAAQIILSSILLRRILYWKNVPV